MNEAVKWDHKKARMDLLSPDALLGTAQVLSYGAAKYQPRNWETGLQYGRCFAALMRHLWAWWKGEDTDEESGMFHLDHAACCLMFLQHYTNDPNTYGKFDDRPHVNKALVNLISRKKND